MDKYSSIVVEDKPRVEHEYKSQYRGAIQNRDVDVALLPMYQLSYFSYGNGVRGYEAYDPEVDGFNSKRDPLRRLTLTCNQSREKLTDVQSRQIFQLIDALSEGIGVEKDQRVRTALLLQRAVAYAEAQNYSDALADLDDYLAVEPGSVIGRWERAVCQAMQNSYDASKGQNAYLYFDRGNLMAEGKHYDRAIDDYTRAIQIDPRLAEAYYNRGVVRCQAGHTQAGLADLSKAGELGLYDAYALAKRLAKDK